MRNAHGHNFNGTQYSVTNKMKQHSICYHFLLCATSGNANVAQQDIIEHLKKKKERIFHIQVVFSNKAVRNSEAVIHTCSTLLHWKPFGGEAVSEITQFFVKVDTKIYKQDKWVFCLVLHRRAFANARYHDKHLHILEKTREDHKLQKLLCSILRLTF